VRKLAGVLNCSPVPDLVNNLNIFAGTANGTLITFQVQRIMVLGLWFGLFGAYG